MKRGVWWQSVALGLGSAFTACWTVLRLSTQPLIFDTVGQQVLAHQWLQGFHSGSVTGPTNYILKMLLLYMPVDLLPGSPHLKLIVVTILLNVLTFITLCFGLEYILRRFNIAGRRPFWLVMVWTTITAGSLYWIGFANSRNIEVAGGVLLIALGLSISQATRRYMYVLTVLLTSLLFFADPLQLYMTTVPLGIFLLGEVWLDQSRRGNLRAVASWLGAAAVGYLGAGLLVLLCQQIWHVQFAAAGSVLAPKTLPSQVLAALRQLVGLYSGSTDLGRLFFYANSALVVALVGAGTVTMIVRLESRRALLWAGSIICLNLLVYVASGSAGQDANSRYLIMTLPAVVIGSVAVLVYAPKLISRVLIGGLAGIVLVGGVLLAAQVGRQFSPAFPRNHHYEVVDQFLAGGNYGYGSINTALVGAYLSNSMTRVVPLGCTPEHMLQIATLFVDIAYIRSVQASPAREVPLILDEGGVITNTPSVCDEGAIIRQLGEPRHRVVLPDHTRALFYNTETLHKRLLPPIIQGI